MSTASQRPRVAPLSAPYEQEIAQMLAKWMPPDSPAEPLRLFRTLAVHPSLAARMRPLGAGILGSSATVEPRLREIMIHRTCALCGAEYEWGVHAVAFGGALFSEEQIASTSRGGAGDGCWSADQAAVFRLADELHATSAVSDELWGELRTRLKDTQILELLVTAGWYHVIAYICNGLRVTGEEWARTFPPPHGAGIVPVTS
jgi:4-carboxymuconolactone decarboxylase